MSGGLGKTLREAREALGVSASDVASATRIKVQTIEALENEDFSKIPAPIYGKGFIRLYAEYLGLDPVPLVDEYVEAYGPAHPAPALDGGSAGLLQELQEDADEERKAESDEERGKDEPPIPGRLAERVRRLRGIAIEKPVESALTGVGLLVLFLFVLCAASRCAGPDTERRNLRRSVGRPADLGRDLPPPYVEEAH